MPIPQQNTQGKGSTTSFTSVNFSDPPQLPPNVLNTADRSAYNESMAQWWSGVKSSLNTLQQAIATLTKK